jgi:zinc D-Ala-D-Ala carboxypeptidase
MTLKYFTREEFDCQVTGTNNMEREFLEKLDELRGVCGFPFEVTSGYRHPTLHPIEKKKAVPGTHAQGIAADIRITNAADRYTVVSNAVKLGFTGIGIDDDFVHVDTRGTTPVIWLY